MEGIRIITNVIPIHNKVSCAPSKSHGGYQIIWQQWRCKRQSFHGKDWHYCWWFPHALKGKVSTSSVDNKRGNTGSGGSFLLGPKKIIGIASSVTNEKALFFPPKGVLGKGFPLPLTLPLLSLKSNNDVSEQPRAEVFASTIGVKALNMMMGQMMTYSFLESLSKGKRFGGMKAKDHWIIWQQWRLSGRAFMAKIGIIGGCFPCPKG